MKTTVLLFCLFSCALVAGQRTTQVQRASTPLAIDESKLIDLTHSFDESTVYWPNAKPFRWEKEHWGKTESGSWYASARYAASEHGGTHADSPIHFAQGKATIDEVPLRQFVGPAVVIDVTKKCERDADYQVSVGDIRQWERTHGSIPNGAIVLLRTGWSKFWPDKKAYLGSDVPQDTTRLHFPGLSREATLYLTRLGVVKGVGIDTASIDPGTSRDFIAHQILSVADLYSLENLAALNNLPERGAWVIALPMKIKGGSGAPARVIAILP